MLYVLLMLELLVWALHYGIRELRVWGRMDKVVSKR